MNEEQIYDELYEYIADWADKEEKSDNFTQEVYQQGFVAGMRYVKQYLFQRMQDIGKGYMPDRCFGGSVEPIELTSARKQAYLNAANMSMPSKCPHCGRYASEF